MNCRWGFGIKVHPHAAGAKGGNQDMSHTKGAQHQIHLAVDAHGMPVKVIITQAAGLIEGFEAEHLFADKAYDTDDILQHCADNAINAVIPPKKNRTKHTSSYLAAVHIRCLFLWVK